MKRLLLSCLCLVAGLFLVRPVQAVGATLSLSPATKNVAVGESFNVDLDIDSGGQAVSSVSAVLTYDTNLLTVVVIPGTAVPIAKTTAVGGIITIQSGALSQNFTGSGVIATLNFRTKKAGTAQVAITFTGSSGSSIVTGANGTSNILDLVNNGIYVIGSGGTTTTTMATTTTVPATGTIKETMVILAGGLILLFLGAKIWTRRLKV